MMKLGNGKWEHTLFNARLQPKEIAKDTKRGEGSGFTLLTSDPQDRKTPRWFGSVRSKVNKVKHDPSSLCCTI